MRDDDGYWFPAKRIGWGWGLPCRPEGWAVMAVYAIAIALVFLFLPPAVDLGAFLGATLLLTLLLVAVCWWKGEPPRWRG